MLSAFVKSIIIFILLQIGLLWCAKHIKTISTFMAFSHKIGRHQENPTINKFFLDGHYPSRNTINLAHPMGLCPWVFTWRVTNINLNIFLNGRYASRKLCKYVIFFRCQNLKWVQNFFWFLEDIFFMDHAWQVLDMYCPLRDVFLDVFWLSRKEGISLMSFAHWKNILLDVFGPSKKPRRRNHIFFIFV